MSKWSAPEEVTEMLELLRDIAAAGDGGATARDLTRPPERPAQVYWPRREPGGRESQRDTLQSLAALEEADAVWWEFGGDGNAHWRLTELGDCVLAAAEAR